MSAGFSLGPPSVTGEQMPNPVRQSFGRIKYGQVVNRQLASSGDIRLDAAEIAPIQAAPSGTVELRLDLRETAEYVTPLDPGLCNPGTGALPGTGLRAIITISPDWTSNISDELCVPVWSFSSGELTETYSLVAPQLPEGVESETHSVTVSIQQPGLGTDAVHRDLEVTREGFDEPQDGGGGVGGGGFFGAVLDTVVSNPIGSAVAIVAISLAVQASDIFSG